MQNPNTLIAIAHVSENGNNPYYAFCEYIKYCVFSNANNTMDLGSIKEGVGSEFGLFIPNNILFKCLKQLETDGFVSLLDHQITRVGTFDVNSFEERRSTFRKTEEALITSLIEYAAKYKKEWTYEYARTLLVEILDGDGLAYDIFFKKQTIVPDEIQSNEDCSSPECLQQDIDAITSDQDDSQPMFPDRQYVGKFISEVLSGDSVIRDYLLKICEGLMICIGAYQLQNGNYGSSVSQISGTVFYFDTRLLLRYIGCASHAAIEATQELVKLIQNAGGLVCYFPQTLEEMQKAFDEAIISLNNGYTPKDSEMRVYSASVKHQKTIIAAKRANLCNELNESKIYLRKLIDHTENDRISFGFDRLDLQQYMQSHLGWDPRTIENDATSIWETHMCRYGNYSEYCGTSDRLCVFVTSNSRLIRIALEYRSERANTNGIYGWRQNRLPVITDVRLTCRLWSPTTEHERIPLLRLSANAVAAQQPTPKFLNKIRELATALQEQVPEYSNIFLPEFFDDQVTETVFEKVQGQEDKLDISAFASSIAELSELKARDQEEKAHMVEDERDTVNAQLRKQTEAIIDDSVSRSKNKLGVWKTLLWMGLHWALVVTVLCAGLSAFIALLVGDATIMLSIGIPIILKIFEEVSSSAFVMKWILHRLLPSAEEAYKSRIKESLGQSALPYEAEIVDKCFTESDLLQKCKKIVSSQNT